MIHNNSRKAYHELNLSARQKAVLGLYCVGPQTDRRTLQKLTGDPDGDLNKVRPRITELIQKGALVEKDKVKCRWTQRTVRLVGLPNGQMEAF